MKKIFATICILSIIFTLCGCKSKSQIDEYEAMPARSEQENAVSKSPDKDEPNDTEPSTTPNQSNDTEPSTTPNQSNDTSKVDNTVESNPKTEETMIGEVKVEKAQPLEINTVEDMIKYYNAADIFVGKVIAVEKITPTAPIYRIHNDNCEGCDDYFVLNEDLVHEIFPIHSEIYRYTVKIEKTVNSVFTQPDTTVHIIADVDGGESAYIVGQRYLMYGTLYEYEQKAVLSLWKIFAARVDENENLKGLFVNAKILDEIATVDNLISNQTLKQLYEKSIVIPEEILARYGAKQHTTASDEANKPILDSIIADGKKAIIADSDFKMNLERKNDVK